MNSQHIFVQVSLRQFSPDLNCWKTIMRIVCMEFKFWATNRGNFQNWKIMNTFLRTPTKMERQNDMKFIFIFVLDGIKKLCVTKKIGKYVEVNRENTQQNFSYFPTALTLGSFIVSKTLNSNGSHKIKNKFWLFWYTKINYACQFIGGKRRNDDVVTYTLHVYS